MTPGAGAPAALNGALDGQEIVRKAIDELTRLERRRDARRESHLAAPLVELADELLGQVLLSIAYAMHVGDPEGAVLLAGDISSGTTSALASRTAPRAPARRGRCRARRSLRMCRGM